MNKKIQSLWIISNNPAWDDGSVHEAKYFITNYNQLYQLS